MALPIRLRTAFAVYLGLLHLLVGVLAWRALRVEPLLLVLVEVGLLLSLYLGYRLLRALAAPIDLVRTGSEMIQEGELMTHFRAVGQPDVDRLLEVYNSMIDRLRDERLRVREQNEFLDRLIEASPGGVVVCDFDGRISEVNPAAASILGGRESALLRDLPENHPVLSALLDLEPGRSRVLPIEGGRRLRGTRGRFRDRGFARTFFLLEELTEELRRSEKEAYGHLIRTISHEVNNSIGPVASLVDTIGAYSDRLQEGDRRSFEEGIAIASQRLDHLRSFVEGYADVVRLPPPSPTRCDLGRMVDEVMVLMTPLLEEREISWRWLRRPDGRPVEADKNQLEQVLLNVLRNAMEAIGEKGAIEVDSGHDNVGPWLSIRDSGPGLDEQTLASVFRPFYTTKATGRGLGLTLVNEILTHHGFRFALENAEGGGAVFRMELATDR